MEMLPHPSVAHLMPLFKYFNDFVDRLITTDCSLDDHEYIEVKNVNCVPIGFRSYVEKLQTTLRHVDSFVKIKMIL